MERWKAWAFAAALAALAVTGGCILSPTAPPSNLVGCAPGPAAPAAPTAPSS